MIRTLAKGCVPGLGSALVLLAGAAMADVPAALDRAPADAPVVIAVPNMARLNEAMRTLKEMFPFEDQDESLKVGMAVFGAAGVDQDGSMAVVFSMPNEEAGDAEDAEDDGMDWDDEGDGGAPFVVVVPVKDYGAFARGLGGDAGAAVSQLSADDMTLFGKDLGGGYAALGADAKSVDAFAGRAGSLAAYRDLLGASGTKVAETSDVVVIANLPVLAPEIKKGLASAREQMGMMGAMAQQDMTAAIAMMDMVSGTMLRDARAGFIGFDVEADGLAVQSGANFAAGSETAAMFQGRGNAVGLLASLPSMAESGFLLALAYDTSSPGLKKFMDQFAAMRAQAAAGGAGEHLMGWLNKSDGAAVVMGSSPAMGGAGFFANTVMFGKSADPSSLIAQFKGATEALNGRTEQMVTFATSYKPGAVTVAGTAADEWRIGLKMDPNNPAAGQAQMMMPMLFGPAGGPAGYVAPAKGGVVMTMGRNSALLERALRASRGESATLAGDAGIAAIAPHLPEGRVLEAYIGVKDIAMMAMSVMAMTGMPIEFEVPPDLPPVGIGATMQDGGVRAVTFVPAAVLKTGAAVSKALEDQQMRGFEDDVDEDMPTGGRPRF